MQPSLRTPAGLVRPVRADKIAYVAGQGGGCRLLEVYLMQGGEDAESKGRHGRVG